MSLSDDLRDELALINPERRCCRLAELSALFHSSGAWHLRGGSVAVHLDLSGSGIARRAFALLRDLGVRSEIRTYSQRAFEQATRYQLHVTVDAEALAMLREAGVLSASGAPLEVRRSAWSEDPAAAGRTARSASRRRLALGPPGPAPRDSDQRTLEAARFIQDVARLPEGGLALAERRSHALVYAKGHDAIGAVLALAGAGDTALVLEEHAVLSSLRADANRLANADEANLERVARAAHRQLEAIRAIGLDALPADLVEIAELRLRHPSASLAELAAKARPPLTKSAAHRRLQAVTRLRET